MVEYFGIPWRMSMSIVSGVYMFSMLVCLQSPDMWLFVSLLLQRGQQFVDDILNHLALFILCRVPVRYLRAVVWAPVSMWICGSLLSGVV